MKEQVTLRLYEDPAVPTARDSDSGRYHPDDMKGWNVERGDMVPLTEDGGGRLFAIVDHIDEVPHLDPDGRRYRLAAVWTQD